MAVLAHTPFWLAAFGVMVGVGGDVALCWLVYLAFMRGIDKRIARDREEHLRLYHSGGKT